MINKILHLLYEGLSHVLSFLLAIIVGAMLIFSVIICAPIYIIVMLGLLFFFELDRKVKLSIIVLIICLIGPSIFGINYFKKSIQHKTHNKPETAVTQAHTYSPPSSYSTIHEHYVDDSPKGTTYVLNKSTKKFHRTGCAAIGQMDSSNRLNFTGSRDEVIDMGYDACGRCNP